VNVRLGGFIPPVAVSVGTFFAHLPLAYLGFDSHHNGLMLATATGVAQGKAIHSEVFTQYGPITSWFQALFVLVGNGSAIALTLWATILISLTAGIVAAVPNVAPRGFGISHRISVPASILWVLVSPSWNMGGIQAWSSLLATFLLVTASLFVLLGIRMREGRQPSNARFPWTVAGALIGVLPFTRINVGIILWFLMLIAFAVFWKSRAWNPSDKRVFIAGWAASASLVLLILSLSHSIGDYVDQGIVTPFLWAVVGESNWEYFFGLFWSDITYLSGRALPLALAAVLLVRFVSPKLLRPVPKALLRLVVVVLATSSFLFAVKAQRIVDWYRGFGPDSQETAVFWAGDEPHLAIWFFFFLSVMMVPTALGFALAKFRATATKVPASVFLGYSFLIVGAASNLVQIHPLGDIYHLWWGSPLLFLGLVKALSFLQKNSQLWTWSPALLLLLAIQITAVIPQFIARDHSGPAGTVVENVRMTQEASLYLEGLRKLKTTALDPDEEALYFVQMGIEVVIDGNFNSVNPIFVSWAMRDSQPPGIDVWSGKTVIDYPGLKHFGYQNFEALAIEFGLEVVSCSYAAEPYYFPNWDTNNPYICVLKPS